MNKIIPILFLLFSSISAQNVAVFCCQKDAQQAERFALENNIEMHTFLKYDNAIIFDGELSEVADICYSTSLKRYKKYLAFPKNEILVRTKKDKQKTFLDFISGYNDLHVIKHNFIPNQFKISNIARNEPELLDFHHLLSNKDFIDKSQINYQFTLSVNAVNDPLFNRQWSIKNEGTLLQGNGTAGADMNVDSAWSVTTGSTNIKIAILDSGVDTLHEDLQANLLAGHDGFANELEDTRGYPTPNFSSDAHGTACAGIVAAVGNNNLGTAGIAYTSKIVPVRIFYYQDFGASLGVQPTTNTEALVNGSAYAWRVANADIMSTSAGLPAIAIAFMGIDTELVNAEINEAFNNARDGKGVAMFFSSGNDDEDIVLWPANLTNTIAVGASTMCDERKNPNDCSNENWGSSFGESLDIVAPGTLVATSDMTGALGYNNTNYTNTFNGTSAACPNAAGVGALVLSVRPDLHARDVRAIINLTADKVSGYDYNENLLFGSWNEEVGYGRVNAYKAIQFAVDYQSTVSIAETTSSFDFNIYPNPSKGIFNIDYKESAQIDIYDINGKLVYQVDKIDGNKISLELQRGLYFVMLKNDLGSSVKKVLIE